MGLASALSTALTGLTAAETTIDVVGNNLANASTVGFKASQALFATQFVQTQSLGSTPTLGSGGTNPRQVGLGTRVAEITPDFTQGTIEVSSSASDLAIQGDGFFIVQGSSGETLYSRNGAFKTNASNQLVTINGNRVLGYGVDDNFQIEPTVLEPINIPLGSAAVAQATTNVTLEGTLKPNGELADTASIISTGVLGDSSIGAPATFPANPVPALAPITEPTAANVGGGGVIDADTYTYRVVYIDGNGNESSPSPVGVNSAATDSTVTVGVGEQVNLTNLATPPAGDAYAWVEGRRIYRANDDSPQEFFLLTEINDRTTTTFTDNISEASIDENSGANPLELPAYPTGQRTYNYRVTYSSSVGALEESRPSPASIEVTVQGDGRVFLDGLPALEDLPNGYDSISIYRSLANDSADFHLVAELPAQAGTTQSFIDGMTDTELATQQAIDFDGPEISLSTTRLLDVIRLDGVDNYQNLFTEEGTLRFTGKKGGRNLDTKEFEVTATSTVQDLVNFMEESMGIRTTNVDPVNPVPASIDTINGGTIIAGGVVNNGRIQIVGNNGVDNSLDISLSSLQFEGASGTVSNVNMPFGTLQQARGESAVTDMVAYDSLGIPVAIRLTAVQESRTSNSTTYRWFADSPDNESAAGGVGISVGTGLITFDGEGTVISVTESTVSVDRRDVSAASPLEFELDFTALSGLAAPNSSMAATQQDGSPPGTLSSYIIGEDGRITGVFTNGISRDLGQIELARFSNNAGLEQRGENLYAAGVNSGLPIIGNPGEQGIGRIISGAVELSNTDIGGNLIDLILASTQYRGNTRTIDTTQRMLDELLNLRR